MNTDRTQSVLLVDDDAQSLKGLSLLLRHAGFVVTATADPTEAADQIRRETFDALVTDLRMPGQSGLDLLRMVRQSVRPLATVLITGEPDLDSAIGAVSHGALRYLIKPIDPDQLREAVEHAASMTRIWRLQQQALAHNRRRNLDQEVALGRRFERSLAELWTAYQPIVFADGELFAHEALLRPGNQCFADADEILLAADKLGRVRELGVKIRGDAIAAWTNHPHPEDVKLFLNLHPLELTDPQLLADGSPLLAIADRTVVEISETADVERLPGGPEALDALHDAGIAVALDDLGSCMANLDFLLRFKPAYAKLDRSLIVGLHNNKEQRLIVAKLVELCKSLSIELIGEGVEHFEELTALRELGCDLFQGYLFGAPRPLPTSENTSNDQ